MAPTKLTKSAIGVWGFGVTGQAAVRFLLRQTADVRLSNQTPVNQANVQVYAPDQLDGFLKDCDLIIPSPGIDLHPYQAYKHKWLSEIDLFAQHWHKPVVAITGTVGKTTVTTLLTNALKQLGIQAKMAGNVGTSMLDMLEQQDQIDIAVVELSSFQLEHAKHFAPDVAVITTLLPNHLDRHITFEAYQSAKCNIFTHQKANQKCLVPPKLLEATSASPAETFCITPTTKVPNKNIPTYHFDQNQAVIFSNGSTHKLICSQELPTTTFAHNWLITCSVLDTLGYKIPDLTKLAGQTYSTLEHRLEFVTKINGVKIYNDSKATVPAATLAALKQFVGQKVTLILGGTSKGVKRAGMICKFASKVESVVLFGSEREQLALWCQQNNISYQTSASLEHAVDLALASPNKSDILLFSPSGASFDLFTNYKERGKQFKALIQAAQR